MTPVQPRAALRRHLPIHGSDWSPPFGTSSYELTTHGLANATAPPNHNPRQRLVITILQDVLLRTDYCKTNPRSGGDNLHHHAGSGSCNIAARHRVKGPSPAAVYQVPPPDAVSDTLLP